MRLDADKLRAEVDAHRERMEGPLWAENEGKQHDSWAAQLTAGMQRPEQQADEGTTRETVTHPQSTEWESFLSATDETPQSQPRTRASIYAATDQEILPCLDALGQAVERLTATMSRRPLGGGDVPGWLETAAGDPHTYDAPNAERTGVCVRVLPTTYVQLQQVQRRMGLRTTAGAWEFLLRLGFAAVQRLPVA
jgi:hypothetical protein